MKKVYGTIHQERYVTFAIQTPMQNQQENVESDSAVTVINKKINSLII